jgi:hypothetical protein
MKTAHLLLVNGVTVGAVAAMTFGEIAGGFTFALTMAFISLIGMGARDIL